MTTGSLTEQLRRLTRTSRGRGRLEPAAERDAIAVAFSEATPTSNQTQPVVSSFVGLDDTPSDYTDAAEKFLQVNTAGDAVEFVDSPIASPLTEQSRTTTTVRVCCSTDATLFVDIEVATQVTFSDANGTTIVLNLTPDTTSNCP